MNRPLTSAARAALLARLTDKIADPATLSSLQQRLKHHQAELFGQLPDLLLRSTDAQSAVNRWLADKDLSHWYPQAEGGTAAQGWQFESVSWNRSRGAEPMGLFDMSRAHSDGGFDALLGEGMLQELSHECMESALLAAGLSLALWLVVHRKQWSESSRLERDILLKRGLAEIGLASLSGIAASLILSVALAFLPGGQLLLTSLLAVNLCRALPRPEADPFDLRGSSQVFYRHSQ